MSIYGDPILLSGGENDDFLGGVRVFGGPVLHKKIGPFKNASNEGYFGAIDESGSDIILNTSQPFEVGMTLRFTTLQQSVIALCGSRTGGICKAPSIALDTNGTHCIFAVSCNGASWTSLLSVLPSGYPGLPADTDLFFKMAWDGSTWSGLVDDGTTVMTNSVSLGTPYFNSTDHFYFATQGGSDAYAVKTGKFDMTKALYMKQNGVLIWGREG